MSATQRTARRPPLVAGWPGRVLLVLGLIAFQIVGTFGAGRGQHEREAVDVVAVALVVAAALPLLWRRRYPLSVLVVSHSIVLAYWLLDYPGGPIFLSPFIAFFTAVLHGRRIGAWIVLAVGFVAFTLLPMLVRDEPAPALGQVVGVAAWLFVIAAAAEIVRVRRERMAEAAHMQEEEARRRASEERLRIARELHDVLAHNISMINVQAGVALHLLDEKPEQARPALTAIKQASKDALTELRSVLGVLRRVDEEDGSKDPAPTLARLDDLISRAKAAGLSVSKDVEGSVRSLPAPVDLAAFRIVQEALTNVLRHAGGVDVDRARALRRRRGHGAGRRRRPRLGPEVAGLRERHRRHARACGVGRRLPRGGPPTGGRRIPRAGATAARGALVIRVLLADDQALVRAGFRALLDAEPDIEVVGEAGDGIEAIELTRALMPEVVLMDVRMPELDGLAATRAIADDDALSKVHVVILTTFEQDEYVFESLKAGASGFLVKDTEPADLVRAVRAVAAGDALLSPGVTRRLIEEYASHAKEAGSSATLEQLTEREREVMALVAEGLSNEEISQRLFVSPATAKTHVSRAMVKLRARDRAQLVVFAYESGLVRPGWLD